MALTVPDQANASFSAQADLDAVDFDAIVAGFNESYVVTGLAVSQRAAGANLSVDVAAGQAIVTGVIATVASTTNVAVTADATNPRFALISVNSAGTLAATMGTAAANPVFPAIPGSSVLLAAVWIPAAAASVLNANIVDKRVINGGSDVVSSGSATADAITSYVGASAGAVAGYVGVAGHVFSDTASGDAVVQASNSAKALRLGVGTGGAAQAVLTNTALTLPSTVALTIGTKTTRAGSIALAATANTATALGQFAPNNGSLALRLHLHLITAGVTRTKTYEFVVDTASDTTNTYYKVLPADQSLAQVASSDVFLVAYRPSTQNNTWQFWVCTTPTFASTGTLTWSAESYGDTVVTYASTLSPATASPTLPFAGGLHPSNSLDTVAGFVGIGTDAPTVALAVQTTAATNVSLSSSSVTGNALVQFGAGGVAAATGGQVGEVGASGNILTDSVGGDTVLAGRSSSAALRLGMNGSASTLRITSTDVQINDNGTARSVPRGLLVASYLNTNSTGTTSTSLVNVATAANGVTNMLTGATSAVLSVTATLVSGRRYLVEFSGTMSTTVSGDVGGIAIIPGVAPNVWIGGAVTLANVDLRTGVFYHFHADAIAIPNATGSVTFTAQHERRTGTGSISEGTGTMLRIWDMGA